MFSGAWIHQDDSEEVHKTLRIQGLVADKHASAKLHFLLDCWRHLMKNYDISHTRKKLNNISVLDAHCTCSF